MIKKILGNLPGTLVAILAAAVIIQFLMAKNDRLKSENQNLKAIVQSDSLQAVKYKKALEDTTEYYAKNKPLPETTKIKVPYPIHYDTAGPDKDIIKFTAAQLDKYFRDNCTGVIEDTFTAMFADGSGAHVWYYATYGTGNDIRKHNVTPVGRELQSTLSPSTPKITGGVEWAIAHGQVSFSAGATYRSKWEPGIRLDIKDGGETWWVKLRRNF